MHLCISGITPEKFCPDLHFIPTHTSCTSKEVFATAEEGGEHLHWDQLQPAGSALK